MYLLFYIVMFVVYVVTLHCYIVVVTVKLSELQTNKVCKDLAIYTDHNDIMYHIRTVSQGLITNKFYNMYYVLFLYNTPCLRTYQTTLV